MIEGRKVKFYPPAPDPNKEDPYEIGTMHQWFLVSGSIVVPYALIERDDGTMVFVNYHDVIFEPEKEETIDDYLVRGFVSEGGFFK